MPLRRILSVVPALLLSAAVFADGGGGGGGGVISEPEPPPRLIGGGLVVGGSTTAPDPDRVPEKCRKSAAPLTGKSREAALKKLIADGAGTPKWLAARGVKVSDWDALDRNGRTERRLEAAAWEYCVVSDTIFTYEDLLLRLSAYPDRALCAHSPEVQRQWLRRARDAKTLSATLAARYPYGFAALQAESEINGLLRESLAGMPATATAFEGKLGMIAAQCAYGRSKLDAAKNGKEIAEAGKRFGGKLDASKLAKGFDNARPGPGVAVPGAGLPRAKPPGLSAPGEPGKPRTPAVRKPETFENLTEGIRLFPGKDQNLSKRERRKRQQIFDRAMRHIYSIPEGKKILRDLQRVRELKTAEVIAEKEKTEASIPPMEKALALKTKALARLESENPKAADTRLWMPNGESGSYPDEVDPYKSLKSCPKGMKPVVVDFPNKGDRTCRPGEGKAGLYRAGSNKSGEYAHGAKIDSCPNGTYPVLTNAPAPGDRACRPKHLIPELVRKLGHGPYIHVRTNDPFQPYKIVDKCPGRTQPVITNWPAAGDRGCFGPGRWGGRGELKDAIARDRANIDGTKTYLDTIEKNPAPVVAVTIGPTEEMVGGHAQPTYYPLYKFDGLGARIITPVHISDRFLKDRNPSRAVDKILVHEFRHVADRGLFQDSTASRARWMLGEDRAYLSEAKAVMEQLPGMKGEKRSQFIDQLKSGIVGRTLRDPKAFRIERLSSPLYFWHVTHGDLADPEAGVRGRLHRAFKRLYYAPPKLRGEILEHIDEDGTIAEALKKAKEERSGDDWTDLVKRENRFVEEALKSPAIESWIARVRGLSNQGKNGEPPEWLKRFEAMEDEFWTDLQRFTQRYERR
jgi:hypothetical protein